MRVLNPYLFIGLGGSGGKTLQYLHYYLDQRLKRAGWEEGLPKAWQFVWFDVPPEPEQLISDGGIPPLPIENYFSFTNKQISRLDQIDKALQQKNQGKNTIMGWAPNTGAGAPPIQKGAGQFRGVGRLIALSQYEDIQKKLISSYNKISDSDVEEELKRLTAHMNGIKPSVLQGIEVPKVIPILVSSLAGGCGAGSFLDVADILKTVDPGAKWLNDSYAFLYTPDVFHKINADGLHPNALAAISELLSGCYSNFEDTQSYSYLVSQLGYRPIATTRGPAYPILIGRSNGQIDFGNQENVYKTTSRALMGMALSTSVQQQMSNFIEANMTEGNIKTNDLTGLYDVTGKIFSPKVLSWGYSSVSLGRDYFADYCVERFTTKVLDRISEHHKTPEVLNGIKTENQSIEELSKRHFGEFIQRCGLNELGVGKENDQVIEELLSEKERKNLTIDIVNKIATSSNQNIDSKPVSGEEWFLRYKNATPSNLRILEENTKVETVKNAQKWTEEIEDRILTVTSSFLGRVGGQVTNRMLELLIDEMTQIEEELSNESEEHRRAYNSWDQAYSATLNGQSGKFDSNDTVFTEVKKNLANKLIGFPNYFVRVVAIDLINDVKINLVSKILNHVTDLTYNSTKEGRKKFNADSWASAHNNPSRLHGADNEFFVDDPEEFPLIYEKYLIKNAGDEADGMLGAAENICIDNYLSEFRDGIGVLINSDTPWVPITVEYRSNLNSMASTGIYKSISTPLLFIERTRTWFEQKENIFKNYLNQSLTDYLLSEGLTASDKTKRSNEIASKISSALDTSKPLIKISNDSSQLVHGANHKNELKILYTQLPVKGDQLKEVQEATLKVYQQKMSKEHSEAIDKEEAFFQDQDSSINQIEYFTILEQPVQPFIFESLFRDIVKSWTSKNATAVDVTSFWKDRRTRSLDEFLPFPKEVIFGFVRGYFVSKLTNEFKFESDRNLGFKASIDNINFPFPLVEVSHNEPNLLGVILETLPLAYSLYSMNVENSSLKGYLKLLDYGKSTDGALDLDDLTSFTFVDEIKEKIRKEEKYWNDKLSPIIKEIEKLYNEKAELEKEPLQTKLDELTSQLEKLYNEKAELEKNLPTNRIRNLQESYLNHFNEVSAKQRDNVIRKKTQTYEIRDFIKSAIESVIYALDNIDSENTNGTF